MAVSPLIPPSPSATVQQKNATSGIPLTAQAKVSSPRPMQHAADREITEQMNDEVRHKYIKGMCYLMWLGFVRKIYCGSY